MSVSFIPQGESGSIISQAVAARLFAEKHNLQFSTKYPDPDLTLFQHKVKIRTDPLVDMTPPKLGASYSAPIVMITNENHAQWVAKDTVEPAHYIFSGDFANSKYFDANKAAIKKFIIFDPEPYTLLNPVGLHYRFGGYRSVFGGCKIVDPSYYIDILKTLDFGICTVATDEPHHPCIKMLDDAFPGKITLIPNCHGPRVAFHTLARFERVVVGQSSFSFWSTFLGHAKQVWTFKRGLGGEYPMHQLSEFAGSIPTDGVFWTPTP